jgi:hypothetical protein
MSVADVVAIVHMGRALCGHDGIIHGGLIATVFDETLARNVRLPGLWRFGRPANMQALLNLPTHIGVTASLTIDYKAPTQADQVCVLYPSHRPKLTSSSSSFEPSWIRRTDVKSMSVDPWRLSKDRDWQKHSKPGASIPWA